MGTGQGEAAEIVIEIGILPIRGVMASRAIRAVLSKVFVILAMAGVTIHGRPFELAVDMAVLTSRLRVLTLEFERREVVIEGCRRPAIRRVALAAILSKTAFVWVIVPVTGRAILGGHLEVTQSSGIEMTLDTGDLSVRSGKPERKDGVIEILVKAVHTVMAIEAG